MIRLHREVRFHVAAGDVARPRASENSWAGTASGHDLVPYFRLVITAAGETDPVTGYLCDIKALDRLAHEHVVPAAISASSGRRTALELLRAAFSALAGSLPGNASLERLVLHLSPFVSITMHANDVDTVFLTEQFEFSAAHRLHVAELSDAENRAVFGKCNSSNGHGHNYVVEIMLAAVPESPAGLVARRRQLAEVVRREVLEPFDHKHLNLDTEEFRQVNPTVENIARVVYRKLVPALAPVRLVRVRIYETPKTWADYGEVESLRLLA